MCIYLHRQRKQKGNKLLILCQIVQLKKRQENKNKLCHNKKYLQFALKKTIFRHNTGSLMTLVQGLELMLLVWVSGWTSSFISEMERKWKLSLMTLPQEKAGQTENLWLFLEQCVNRLQGKEPQWNLEGKANLKSHAKIHIPGVGVARIRNW